MKFLTIVFVYFAFTFYLIQVLLADDSVHRSKRQDDLMTIPEMEPVIIPWLGRGLGPGMGLGLGPRMGLGLGPRMRPWPCPNCPFNQ
jgi:hypothetical protein